MSVHDQSYVARHFWRLDELVQAVGAPSDRVEALIAARCAPGPIYTLGEDGWWSALERRDRPPPVGEAWYSPGAAWGLRRAVLAIRSGAADGEAALLLEQSFCGGFVNALEDVQDAELAFPRCFVRQGLDVDAARRIARSEWGSWLDGGYGVCPRVFTGRSCVAKEALSASLRTSLAAGDYDPVRLLGLAEALAEIILPFAPWQRAACTPGLTIDRLLDEQGLGCDHPAAARRRHLSTDAPDLVRGSGSPSA